MQYLGACTALKAHARACICLGVKVFYYGVGFSLLASILTPTIILTLGSRYSSSKSCSYIWIFVSA